MDSVAEIKSRLSIVDVVSQYCQLKKAGRNFKACCPFHSEKTPSFIISPERQFAWCYGCQTGGDIFKIVQLLEGVDFKESLKILADKAGVELPTNFSGGVKKEKKDLLVEINEAARDFFVAELRENSEAQKYLQNRGLKKSTIEEWGIGFAPDGFENLFPKLEEKFPKKEIIEAGVAGLKEMGSEKLFDKFRNRIMFPIADHRGRVVAFTGRVLDDSEPKYLNSAESPIFTKGAILFGFAKAREGMRESKFAVIVEGQLDVISAHQKGFKNVVASSGTALTEMHLKSLKNIAERVVFCFDSDSAGVESTIRALEIAAALDLDSKIAILPDGVKDPDEAIQKDPQIFADAITDAVSPLEFFFRKVFAKTDLNEISEKKKVVRRLLTFAQKITSAVERDDFIRQAGTKLGIAESVLTEELENLPRTFSTMIEEKEIHADKISARDWLIGLVVAFPEVAKEFDEELKKLGLEEIEIKENEEKLALLVSDKYSEFSDEKIKKELESLFAKLSKQSLEERKHDLKMEMQKAEEEGDDAKAAELFGEYQKLMGK
ncbi:DNA primase [Candidatus Gracilibacteria bacterium]|nr:DNA primase [Candidatus Gracilibacteria bacterium]MCF7856324.1 DNA primase [Candidatus Gracilibacteria bacterium]MCF7896679.1 DNA primase [Candidatus Gracilibacteria bacterium]